MRAYELMVIIHPGLDEAAVNQTLDNFEFWNGNIEDNNN